MRYWTPKPTRRELIEYALQFVGLLAMGAVMLLTAVCC